MTKPKNMERNMRHLLTAILLVLLPMSGRAYENMIDDIVGKHGTPVNMIAAPPVSPQMNRHDESTLKHATARLATNRNSVRKKVEVEHPNNIITFADAEVKRICVENWDTNGDGELSEGEAAAVDDIGQVFEENETITSFEELKYFVGLTELSPGCFEICTALSTIIIPNSVISIGDWAFESCIGLTSIIIPISVTSIGFNAFYGCSGLTSIIVESGNTVFDSRGNCNAIIRTADNALIAGCQNTIVPISIEIIGDRAFSGCISLTSITIPNSVTSIENGAFYGCSGLTSITIPNSVTSIGNGAFYGCSGLTSITIPNSVTSIGSYALYGCTGLSSIAIPNSVTSIGDWTFGGCSGLTSITLPNSVMSIGYDAFAYCSELRSISFSNGLTTIDDFAFWACSSLTSINLPNSVTSIGECAFAECSNLQTMVLPDNMNKIGRWAFQNCSSLESIKIPTGIKILEKSTFLKCSALTTVELPTTIEKVDSVAFYGCTKLSSISIPNSVTFIDYGAFVLCESLESLSLPNSLEIIGEQAFVACNSLKSMTIPMNVKEMGLGLFGSCTAMESLVVDEQNPYFDSRHGCNGIVEKSTNMLRYACKATTIPKDVVGIANYCFIWVPGIEELTIPDNIKTIGYNAFEECSDLKRVILPSTIEVIDEEAFLECVNLKSVTILKPEPFGIPDNVFHMKVVWNEERTEYTTSDFTTATLYVPYGSKSKYQAADGWKNFANIVELDIAASGYHHVVSFTGGGWSATKSSIGSWTNSGFTFKTTAAEMGQGLSAIDGAMTPYYLDSNYTLEYKGNVLKQYAVGAMITEGKTYAKFTESSTDKGVVTEVPTMDANAYSTLQWTMSAQQTKSLWIDNTPRPDADSVAVRYMYDPDGDGISNDISKDIYVLFRTGGLLYIEETPLTGTVYWGSRKNPNYWYAKNSMMPGSGLSEIHVTADLPEESLQEMALDMSIIIGSAFIGNRIVDLSSADDMDSFVSLSSSAVSATDLDLDLQFVEGEKKSFKGIGTDGKTYQYVTRIGNGNKTLQAFRDNNQNGIQDNGEVSYTIAQLVYAYQYDINNIVVELVNTDVAKALLNYSSINGLNDDVLTAYVGLKAKYGTVEIPLDYSPIGVRFIRPINANGNMVTIEVENSQTEYDVNLTSLPSLTDWRNEPLLASNRYYYGIKSIQIVGSESSNLADNTNVLTNYGQKNPYTFVSLGDVTTQIAFDYSPRFVSSGSSSPSAYGTINISNLSSVNQDFTVRLPLKVEYIWGEVFTTVDIVIDYPEPVNLTAQSYTREYGDDNPTFEYTSEGATITGTPSITCSATKTSPVGTYPIVISKGSVENGNVTFINGTLTITKALLTVTADNKEMTQGQPVPTLTVSYSGFKNGETESVLTTKPTATTTASSLSEPGTYPITISGGVAQNYELSYKSGTLTVTQADQIAIVVKSCEREYGEDNPAFEYTVTGGTITGKPQITCEAGKDAAVGTYDIKISAGSLDYPNLVLVGGTLTVTKAPLLVKADDKTMKQGDDVPELTLSYSGFKNGETASVLTKAPTATTTAAPDSKPGKYPITVSGGEAENYQLSYENGTLTVTAADPITITVVSTSREYGDENPAFEYTVEGGTIQGLPQITCEAGKDAVVGTYDIKIETGSIKYPNLKLVGGILTVTKAPLLVKADDKTMKQGDEVPSLTVTYSGFKNGETEVVLTKKPTASTTVTPESEPGEYPITVTGGEAQNYELSYKDGTMRVMEADPITITVVSTIREYGEENPAFEYTVTGGTITGKPQITCEAGKDAPVGTYDIKISAGTLDYPNLILVGGTQTVTKASLTVTADDKIMTQGDEMPELTVSYSGFKNGETEGVLTALPAVETTATPDSEPGEYPITVSGGEAWNYSLSYRNGTLTVEKEEVPEPDQKQLVVTANLKSGEVAKGTEITLTVHDEDGEDVDGADIYYTIDGSTPTKNSLPYNNFVTINETTTLKAIAYKSGYTTSKVLKVTYTVIEDDTDEQWEDPETGVVYAYNTGETMAKVRRVKSSATGEITIRGTISVDGKEYTVTEVAKRAFAGAAYVTSVTVPASVTNLGESAFANDALLSLVWQSNSDVPADVLPEEGERSKNFLLYVNRKGMAPYGMGNVVVKADEDYQMQGTLTLQENEGFHCPVAFKAEAISYTHAYQMTSGIGNSEGWETLALPFDVETIRHADGRVLVPFASYRADSDNRPFWLYAMSESGFVKTGSIKANTPYIICMPNNGAYLPEYNITGEVTFMAHNVMVQPSTDVQTVTAGNRIFVPTFRKIRSSSSVATLNSVNRLHSNTGGEAPGSRFISNLRLASPFEAVFEGSASNVRSFAIDFAPGVTNGIDDIPATRPGEQRIYNLKGQRVSKMQRGHLYIVDGRKRMAK